MSRLRPSEEELAAGLELAAERHELSLVYQPKIYLKDGHLAGVEALMRWQSPDFGSLPPDEFIPIAERSGVIDGLTEWAARKALDQWLAWRDQGFRTTIALNISALTLRDVHFPDYLQRLCRLQNVPEGGLILEITEGATQHAIRLLDTLTRFRIKGFHLALDDFGTGYSSLLQLRQLPFTELKIDRCFVEGLAEDAELQLIVKSVIDLAHGLGILATAEGVETQEVFCLLRDMGCDQAQGFLIAEAMEGPKLVPWMLESLGSWRNICVSAVEPAEPLASAA